MNKKNKELANLTEKRLAMIDRHQTELPIPQNISIELEDKENFKLTYEDEIKRLKEIIVKLRTALRPYLEKELAKTIDAYGSGLYKEQKKAYDYIKYLKNKYFELIGRKYKR